MSTNADQDGGRGWDDTRRRVLDRDGHACRFCGTTDDEHREAHDTGLHVHHVIPRDDGGDDEPENLLTVCCRCHRTLEETHARAVAEMKRREDYTEDIEGVAHVWHDRERTVKDLEDALAKFVDEHPTFAREFNIKINERGCVEAWQFMDATASAGDVRVESEWDFAVAWGYKEGVTDVISALAGHTDGIYNAPADDQDSDTDALDESGPYDPTEEFGE